MNEVQFRGLLDFLKGLDYHVGKDSHQMAYVRALADACNPNTDGSSNSVFLDAEAGTGKTTLATLVGAYAIEQKMVDLLLYVRAEVDVLGGKERGALPGNDGEKNAPYQLPFIETLDQIHPGLYEKWIRLQKPKVLATHPGHFRGITRGRTFLVLDEAQNLTTSQLKATYTRFKNDSVIATLGHSGQCDIPPKMQERIAGFLPFNLYAIHHKKKGGWVGTLEKNYRGEFAQWSDRLEITIKELLEDK